MSDAVGFKESEIMFSSNATPAEDFKLARKLNVNINLDDITHIDFLEKVADIPETVCCRYNPGGHFAIANNIMDNPGDAKYGMTHEQIIEAYKILKSKGVKNFGIHAFLASNTVTNEYYPELARILFELAVELKEKTGAHISFINLSGGIGIATSLNSRIMMYWQSAKACVRCLKRCLYLQAWAMLSCSPSLAVTCWHRMALW